MEIKIRNNQNIYRTNLSPQNVQKNGYFSNNSLKNDVFEKANVTFKGLNPEEILKSFEKFEITEYKKLIPEQIEVLRDGMSERLIKDRNAGIVIGDIIKDCLEKTYPNGYVLCIIGRSLTVPVKSLEHRGMRDIKYCPFTTSRIGKPAPNGLFKDIISGLPTEKVSKYGEYLKSIGLSPTEIEKSQKTYVFTDYTGSGDTLKNFQILLERPEIGINSNNVHYKSLNKDLISGLYDESSLIELEGNRYNAKQLIKDYLQQHGFKLGVYPHIQRLPYTDLDEVKKIMEQPYYEKSKKMQFALIDYFAKKGLLKE